MSAPAGDTLRLVHHHPGRVRLRAECLRERSDRAQAVESALSAVPSVRRVTHNPLTGSVLVEYEPGAVEPDAIVVAALQAAGLHRLRDETLERPDPQAPVEQILRAVRALNGVSEEATDGWADLRTLVPAALFAAGLYSLARRPLLPRWDSLLFWSYRFFIDLNGLEQPREAR